MGLKIGQLRRDQFKKDYEYTVLSKGSGTGDNLYLYKFTHPQGKKPLQDGGIKLPGGASFNKGVTYYMTFKLTGFKVKNNITFKLISLDKGGKISQYMNIKTVTMPSIGEAEYETIFVPNQDYSYLIFELDRGSDNSNGILEDSNYYYSAIPSSIEIKRLTNLITDYFKNEYNDFTYIKRFGLQGPPGLIFSINEEEMRLGKSGIFTLPDINISHLCFLIKEDGGASGDGKQYFILDFQY